MVASNLGRFQLLQVRSSYLVLLLCPSKFCSRENVYITTESIKLISDRHWFQLSSDPLNDADGHFQHDVNGEEMLLMKCTLKYIIKV